MIKIFLCFNSTISHLSSVVFLLIVLFMSTGIKKAAVATQFINNGVPSKLEEIQQMWPKNPNSYFEEMSLLCEELLKPPKITVENYSLFHYHPIADKNKDFPSLS